MKQIDYKKLILTGIVCLLPIIIGVIFYSELPDKIAIHFDINNNPNNYFSKPLFVFGMPIMMLILQTFMCIMNDTQDKYKEANKKATAVSKWILPVISVVLYTITVMYSLGTVIDIRKVVMIILGLIFIVLGNYLPKTKGNNFNSISKRMNPDIYKRVSRVIGYMYIINGILAIMSIVFAPIVSVLTVVFFILETIVTTIYFTIKEKEL